MPTELQLLHRLAHAHGVLTEYEEQAGGIRRPGPESLRAVLGALGIPASGRTELEESLAARLRERWRRRLPGVIVAWDGTAEFELCLPASHDALLELELTHEDGRVEAVEFSPSDCPVLERVELDGRTWVRRTCPLPFHPPHGYHQLRLAGEEVESGASLLLSAPMRAHQGKGERAWGVFLPTYALHTADSWGAGNLCDLDALLEWVEAQGGTVVSTLPLLAAFLEQPFDPSPYAPVSRLFWNEFYLDPTGLPELNDSAAARSLLDSVDFQTTKAELRAAPLVHYGGQMALARRVLDALAQTFFADPCPERTADFETYRRAHAGLDDYARFRAVVDSRGEGWPGWPRRLRDGDIRQGDYREGDYRYHLYAQWNTERQLAAAAGRPPLGELRAGPGRSGLYLDLPLGVHPAGYDTWRERESFVPTVSAGAPPDAFFTRGQNWGFYPPDPERSRANGYAYLRGALANQLRYARYVRIDHVMSLHRLFWIPRGGEPADGTYVRYPYEELYAVHSIESHRHGTILVGEDLGTVPPDVRPAMERHGLRRMYVLQYELQPSAGAGLNPVPADAVAGLDTHDMPTFAAFISGADIGERAQVGHLSPDDVPTEHESRRVQVARLREGLEQAGLLAPGEEDARSALTAALAYLASSPAELVLVNLEDLWLETKPQNLPGTTGDHPNWRRRARYSLVELETLPEVRDVLSRMSAARKRVSVESTGKERDPNATGAEGR